MEPFRGGLDHTREDKKPSDDKGNASDADQLPVSPSLPRGNDRRWASPCPLYEALFRLNYVALPPRPKPAAAAIQEGSYPVSGSRCLKRVGDHIGALLRQAARNLLRRQPGKGRVQLIPSRYIG